jgi:hypothetical protein
MLGKLQRHFLNNVVGYVALFVALGGTAYAANTIGSADVIDESLLSQDIKDGSLTGADIKGTRTPAFVDGSLDTYDIRNKSLLSSDIATNTLTAGELGPNSVSTSELKNGSVTNAKLSPEFINGQGRIANASSETLTGGFPFSTLTTVTITAPANGFVRLDGRVLAWDNNASTHCSDCELAVRIHDVTANADSPRSFFLGGAGSHSSGIEVPVSWVFPVTAGTRSYTLDAGEVDFAGGPLSLYNPGLTAEFVPFGGTGSATSPGVSSATSSSRKLQIGR